jgi:succinoglycan biosynthesis protein ExoA
MRRVLVVIPTLNEAAVIAQTLADLDSELPPDVCSIVVVADGGSTDGTPEIVARLARQRTALHLVANPRRLQSVAVNLAARRFGREADILVRCDAHAFYPPGYVGALAESLERSGADAVVVTMDSVGDTGMRRAVAWLSDTPVGSGGSAHRGGRRSGFVDHGHHAAFRMASFLRAGGYDESFSHNEDAEFDCRQRALGARIWLDAGIRLGYQPRGTVGGLWRQYRAYGRGRSRTVRRHPGSMRLRQFAVPLHLAASVLALGLALRWPLALLWPGLYLAALGLTGLVLAWRHRSACGLLAAPLAAVMHTAWALGFLGGLLTLREPRWRAEAAAGLRLNGGAMP